MAAAAGLGGYEPSTSAAMSNQPPVTLRRGDRVWIGCHMAQRPPEAEMAKLMVCDAAQPGKTFLNRRICRQGLPDSGYIECPDGAATPVFHIHSAGMDAAMPAMTLQVYVFRRKARI
jgi:hypothetical protein